MLKTLKHSNALASSISQQSEAYHASISFLLPGPWFSAHAGDNYNNTSHCYAIIIITVTVVTADLIEHCDCYH